MSGRQEMLSTLHQVDAILEREYQSQDLGNLPDPLDEAVYILLSRQTQGPVFQATFAALRHRFKAWAQLLEVPGSELEELLAPSGFKVQRAGQLQGLLRAVLERNRELGIGPFANPPGDLTLDFLAGMDDEQALADLVALPGIGEKSARCILSYALDRPVFAVDTHVRRILDRLGLVPAGTGKVKHALYDALIPPASRKRLHINLIHHGRATCRSQRPKCDGCVLRPLCQAAQDP